MKIEIFLIRLPVFFFFSNMLFEELAELVNLKFQLGALGYVL